MFKFNQKGFTLLELIVTIFVIAVGLIGAFVVAQYPLSRVSVSMNTLKAAYLAQEGVEIVRNIRDTNWINNRDWDTGLTACEAPLGCDADYDDDSLFSYRDISLNLETAGGFCGYDSGPPTKFKRKIIIDDSKMPDYLKVTVEVFWEEKRKRCDFKLQENLYDYWGS